MTWRLRVQRYPLRVKVLLTLVGAAVVVLGVSTQLSFRYWKAEAVAVAEQQALLAAASARTAVESGLQSGRIEYARRALHQLRVHEPVIAVRVYGRDGSILVSPDETEEGQRRVGVWMPTSRELRADGVVRADMDLDVVRAYVPIRVPPAAVLEVEYSLARVRQAMDRGARLGLGLVIGTIFALAAILFTMLEREVVAPLTRMAGLMGSDEERGSGRDEMQRLEAGVTELLQKESQAAAERKQFMEQAGFAQVGEMAAEMAHEFKRPLASIQSAIQLLSQEYVLEARGQKLLGAVEDQLDHLSETMRDLFTLARPVGLEPDPVSLRAVMDTGLSQIAGHPAAEGLSVERDYPAEDVVVRGDERRLEQVASNLMLNAAEAMDAGGTLTLRFGATGRIGWLEVSDTGSGIPESEIEKVLLPFYSTKPTGTGLGLPLVARIVAAHEGRIGIDSEVGTGTTVRVELPLVAPGSPSPSGSPKEMTWQKHGS
jgi:two-component system, NtrC family, sensor kinase